MNGNLILFITLNSYIKCTIESSKLHQCQKGLCRGVKPTVILNIGQKLKKVEACVFNFKTMNFSKYFHKFVYLLLLIHMAKCVPLNTLYSDNDGKQQKASTQHVEYESLPFPDADWTHKYQTKPTYPYINKNDDSMAEDMNGPTFGTISNDVGYNNYHNDVQQNWNGHSLQEMDNKIYDSHQNSQMGNTQNKKTTLMEEKKKEKDEFVKFLRMLLWDADDEIKEEGEGRQLDLSGGGGYGGQVMYGRGVGGGDQVANWNRQQSLLRWHGLLGRPMPQVLKKQGFASRAYKEFENTCYKLSCTFGVTKLISQISRMFGL